MRLLNFLLHLLLVSLFFWAANMDAQQNGNLPSVRQSTGDLGALGNAVLSGNTVVGNLCWEAPAGSGVACTSCTDANGVVPSFTMGSMGSNASCTGNPFDNECDSQMFWGQATSTGVTAITCSCTFPRQNLGHFMELSGNLTFDAQANSSTSSANPSIAVTSTKQNDVVVADNCNGNHQLVVTDPSQQFSSDANAAELNTEMSFFRTGAAGSQTALYQSVAQGAVLNAVAFKPTALTIGTTKLPDGGNGTVYDAKLTAYGGTGAYTWSITAGSLQSGLSLNASTGEISGTPSATATNSITFKVTDGTNNATAVLPLKIAATLQTISAGSAVCSGFSTVPGSASVLVKQGDAVVQCYKGDDRHGTTGYIMAPSNISDNLGDAYVRANPIPGSKSGAFQCFSAAAAASGSLVPSYNSLGGSPLAGMVCDIPGAQPIVDDLVVNTKAPGAIASPTTLTSSITTPVPNGILLSMSMLDCLATGGGSCTMATSTNAPFVSVSSVIGFGGTPFAVYSQAAPTVTSYSATWNFSDATSPDLSNDSPIGGLLFLRQAAPSSAPTLGEKARRRMN